MPRDKEAMDYGTNYQIPDQMDKERTQEILNMLERGDPNGIEALKDALNEYNLPEDIKSVNETLRGLADNEEITGDDSRETILKYVEKADSELKAAKRAEAVNNLLGAAETNPSATELLKNYTNRTPEPDVKHERP